MPASEVRVVGAEITLHGHRVAYRTAGVRDGRPVLLLIHGIAGDARTFDAVLPLLGRWAYVVAPDLPGHGDSDAAADSSIAGYAAMVRDLMQGLDLPAATVIGHSLGGGVAMQLSYLFPRSVQRLVLVSSGGLGPEVSLFLRAATLPGAELVLPVISAGPVRAAAAWLDQACTVLGAGPRPGMREVGRGIGALSRPGARRAFLRTVRTSLTLRGQVVDARDRLYLTAVLPTMLVWGTRDKILPVSHGLAAHEAAPGSRLEVLENTGHFPHIDEPHRVAALIADFVRGTEPAELTDEAIRDLVLQRGQVAGD